MNRQERRAAQRRGDRQETLAGFQPFLTYDELSIIEEALALWLHETRDDLDGIDLAPRQTWALQRAERLRQGFEAALANRPWRDIAPARDEPK